ncbi:response regulator transcription factor [Streptomyces sp. NPDC056930]|uniref:response regulator transcription factor n=1 Tax=Streptomyces sp. NPDC056930 TaxID=3345967 RepID=UPI0036288867
MHLRTRPEINLVVDDDPSDDPQVTVMVADTVSDDVLVLLRHTRRNSTTRTVLIVADFSEQAVLRAVGCGLAGFVPRSQATPEHLVHVIQTAARGDGYMPPNLLGALMSEVGTLQENVLQGRHFTGRSTREIDVLRLIAEGHDTGAIATKLAYSERTIKSTLHAVMTRYRLRNRSHAVAYAMRQGLI